MSGSLIEAHLVSRADDDTVDGAEINNVDAEFRGRPTSLEGLQRARSLNALKECPAQ